MITAIDNILRAPADRNGNSRFITHYTQWLSTEEQNAIGQHDPSRLYVIALGRALKFGGRRYKAKSYGGGIVLQAYSPSEIVGYIARALEDLHHLRDRGYHLQPTYEGTVRVVRGGTFVSEHAYAADAASAALADAQKISGGAPTPAPTPAPVAAPTQANLAAFAAAVLEVIEDHQNVGVNRASVPFVAPEAAFAAILQLAAPLTRINPDNGLLTALR